MFLDRFLDWAHAGLQDDDDAQAYLHGRGISSEQWARHKLGFTHGDFDVDPSEDLMHCSDCSDREKKHLWCDVCRFRNWSSVWESEEEGSPKIRRAGRRILGSVVFPLTSYSGVIIGFQIRSIREKDPGMTSLWSVLLLLMC